MLKLNLNYFSLLLFLNLFLIIGELYPQEVDIVPYLKAIENGNVGQAKDALVDLKEKYPDDPSVMFLDAVLKENGQEAVVIYQNIVDNYPKSKYADAALYRIFSYYYALGLYDTAREKLKQLKESYPESPYINIADQNLSALENTEKEEKSNAKEENKSVPEEVYKFTIQAGAFTNLENANNLVSEFENAGIYSRLGEKTVGGTTFHVVYAGKFMKYEDAENFLQVVNSRFKLNGSIVPIPTK
ncbi:MAG: SPOR domain-containing protein [Ignavibacteriaceae bacterium]|nr:SPOR domain-containing protein [Chlorobium sp.]MCW9096052.1 SPOR domain-containing protein [Ignavibacteriaceae bacterium]